MPHGGEYKRVDRTDVRTTHYAVLKLELSCVFLAHNSFLHTSFLKKKKHGAVFFNLPLHLLNWLLKK